MKNKIQVISVGFLSLLMLACNPPHPTTKEDARSLSLSGCYKKYWVSDSRNQYCEYGVKLAEQLISKQISEYENNNQSFAIMEISWKVAKEISDLCSDAITRNLLEDRGHKAACVTGAAIYRDTLHELYIKQIQAE